MNRYSFYALTLYFGLAFGCSSSDDSPAPSPVSDVSASVDASTSDDTSASADIDGSDALDQEDIATEDIDETPDVLSADTDETVDVDESDDATPEDDDVWADDIAEGDAGETDTAEVDVVEPPTCDFPGPALPTGPEVEAVQNAPAQCGQPAHVWLDDAALGDFIAVDETLDYPALLITVASQEGGLVPHRPFEYDVVMQRVSYTTQDRGELVESTTLVAVPEGLESDGPVPIVLLLHGTAGFNDTCAPSQTLEWQALAAIFASWGYIAVAPDFLGLKGFGEPSDSLHPYLVGQATAIASLDAVRAAAEVVAAPEMGALCAAPSVAVYGGSQGGHAALWVDRLAPYYTAELSIEGVVASIPPADLLGQIERAITDIVEATANTLGLYGTAPDWYGHLDQLDEFFVASVVPTIDMALKAPCGGSSGVDIDPDDYDTPEALFHPNILAAAQAGTFGDVEPWGCIARENGLTTTSIPRVNPDPEHYGILFIVSEEDALVHPPIQRASYQTLCEQGMPLNYLECAGAGHSEGALWSLPETGQFIDDRLNGVPFVTDTTCLPTAAVVCAGSPTE